MRQLKKFDFYRKYTNEDKVQSVAGACASFIALFVMILFAGYEISTYLFPTINHESVLNRPLDSEQTIPFNMKVLFSKIPCSCNYFVLIPLGMQLLKRDTFGLKFINIRTSDTLRLTRVSKTGEYLHPNYVSAEIGTNYSHLSMSHQIILTEVLENEGCYVKGFIDIFRVFNKE